MATRSSKSAGNEGGGFSRTEIRMSNIHNGEGVTSVDGCEPANRGIEKFDIFLLTSLMDDPLILTSFFEISSILESLGKVQPNQKE